MAGLRLYLTGFIVTWGMSAALPVTAQTIPDGYRLPPLMLPAPGGSYIVGTRRFDIRRLGSTALHVVAWYPAAAAQNAPATYFDPEEQRVEAPAITRNFHWPAAMLDAVTRGLTHGQAGAPVARGRFPLVIFSHGYFLYPRQNTALMEHLASRGYIVLSLGHAGDAADLPGADGVTPTDLTPLWKGVDQAKLLPFWNAADGPALKVAFSSFFAAQRDGRMQNSLKTWRSDIRTLTDAVAARRFPIARAVDIHRIAFGGMSFGGSSSASACQQDIRCRAAFNLDGFEFDETLYDRAARMPLLLIQSDWHAFPNFGKAGTSFTHYDYAYTPWAPTGQASKVDRFLLRGTRHMGLTDLALAPNDTVRDGLFGPASGEAVIAAINDLVTAFLDRQLAGRAGDLNAAAARHAVVERRHPDVARH